MSFDRGAGSNPSYYTAHAAEIAVGPARWRLGGYSSSPGSGRPWCRTQDPDRGERRTSGCGLETPGFISVSINDVVRRGLYPEP